MPADRSAPLVAVPEDGDHREPLARVPEALPEQERRHTAHTTSGPRFLQLSTRLGLLVGLVTFFGVVRGSARCTLRHVHGRDRAPGRDRARQRGGGARARARRRLDLGQRRRRARRRGALRAPRGAGDGRGDLRRPVERAAPADSPGAVQHRHALALVTRSGLGLHARVRRRAGRARHRRSGPRRRGRLLRGQHGPAVDRARCRGPRERLACLARALPLAGAALRRLRLHRRRDRDRLRRGRALRPGGLRRAAAADAQDAGGLPLAHAQERPEAAPGRGDDPHPERLARAGQPASEGALDRRDGEPLGHRRRTRRVHRGPFAPRPAARPRDRPRARALARRARPARPRRALPRHRQARDPGLDPAEARQPDRGGVGADAAAR